MWGTPSNNTVADAKQSESAWSPDSVLVPEQESFAASGEAELSKLRGEVLSKTSLADNPFLRRDRDEVEAKKSSPRPNSMSNSLGIAAAPIKPKPVPKPASQDFYDSARAALAPRRPVLSPEAGPTATADDDIERERLSALRAHVRAAVPRKEEAEEKEKGQQAVAKASVKAPPEEGADGGEALVAEAGKKKEEEGADEADRGEAEPEPEPPEPGAKKPIMSLEDLRVAELEAARSLAEIRAFELEAARSPYRPLHLCGIGAAQQPGSPALSNSLSSIEQARLSRSGSEDVRAEGSPQGSATGSALKPPAASPDAAADVYVPVKLQRGGSNGAIGRIKGLLGRGRKGKAAEPKEEEEEVEEEEEEEAAAAQDVQCLRR